MIRRPARRASFALLAVVDLALMAYAVLGPALVATLLMARYLVVAVLVAFGAVLGPLLSFGQAGHTSLPPPWQLDLGPPEPLAIATITACFSGIGTGLCLLQLRHPTRKGQHAALLCSMLGLAGTYAGSWLR